MVVITILVVVVLIVIILIILIVLLIVIRMVMVSEIETFSSNLCDQDVLSPPDLSSIG